MNSIRGQLLASSSVSAGFPSPAEDVIDRTLDLHELLVKHPAATFFVRVQGHSMTGAGIVSGDILVVDRSLKAQDGDVVIALLDGEFTVKRLQQRGSSLMLIPAHADFAPVHIREGDDFEVWGVVTGVVRELLHP
ncbi:MAG: LexA repressor [candidate division WS6 bacterium OLB20]|uniref:LexA repressor n=1 Tax=candidate division WS6 bacterium OLB20 TaxID=1617426 RepID=A0A136M090_9BACT|nr:MAG: LexA repressor [candidate division WS6 bacterium OLB20]